MSVLIKSFDVKMEVKNKGVEFEVRDNQKGFLGDCIVTRRGLVWCKGKTSPKNGIKVTWKQFISWVEENQKTPSRRRKRPDAEDETAPD